MTVYTITYSDRRGAGVVKHVATLDEAWTALQAINADATVRDASGEIVGGVERTDCADDKRLRWQRWCSR